jgi:hypothetical protein
MPPSGLILPWAEAIHLKPAPVTQIAADLDDVFGAQVCQTCAKRVPNVCQTCASKLDQI